MRRKFSQILICPSCYAQCQKEAKESYGSLLSEQYKRSFYWLMSQISKQHKISNQCPYQYFVQPTERRPTAVWFVQVRQCCQSNKHQPNSGNSGKFIWNATQNRIHPLEVPFRYNVCRCGIRVCRNIVVRMSLKFRIEVYKIGCKPTQRQSRPQIFCVEIWIKIYLISLSINTQRVCRSVLVQSSKVNQAQSSQQEREKVVLREKAVQSRVIYAKATPQPSYNTSTNNGQRTPQTSNYGPSPKRHLTPGQYVSDKCGLNHDQQNNNTNQPNEFTGLRVTCIIQATEKVHINNDEEKRPSVCVQITKQPSVWHVAHQMLYAMKSLINMRCIMHSLKNPSPNLQNKSQSGLYTPIVISIQIGGCRVSNQMILHYILHGLIPLASAQFLKRIFH